MILRTKNCYYHILTVLLGICIVCFSAFYFFQAQKSEVENKLVKIVNYVKIQCSTYTHYNEASESKSLLRTIESYGWMEVLYWMKMGILKVPIVRMMRC